MGPAAPITHRGVRGAAGAAKIKERWGGLAFAGSSSLAWSPELAQRLPFRLFSSFSSVANYGSEF